MPDKTCATYQEIIINGLSIKLIPLGECACGCGGKVPLATHNDKAHNYVKGKPRCKYLPGHNYPYKYRKISQEGDKRNEGRYIMIYKPGHCRADKNGYVYEHILKCEHALGKQLPLGAEPHHIDGNKTNNENSNLVLCQDRSYHMFLEQRTRAYYACGHASWLKCAYCGVYDNPINMYLRQDINGRQAWHILDKILMEDRHGILSVP